MSASRTFSWKLAEPTMIDSPAAADPLDVVPALVVPPPVGLLELLLQAATTIAATPMTAPSAYLLFICLFPFGSSRLRTVLNVLLLRTLRATLRQTRATSAGVMAP